MPDIRKKTWLVDQKLVRQVRRIYRAKTETEAVTRALQEVVFQEELSRAIRSAGPKLRNLEKVF
jgi:hypothetical protein